MANALPVITGLAVGIGFVVVFSIFFTPSLLRDNTSSSAAPIGEVVGSSEVIFVDFAVTLPERDIVVKKGETVKIPITVETFGNVEKILRFSIVPRSQEPDATELALSLENESVVCYQRTI